MIIPSHHLGKALDRMRKPLRNARNTWKWCFIALHSDPSCDVMSLRTEGFSEDLGVCSSQTKKHRKTDQTTGSLPPRSPQRPQTIS